MTSITALAAPVRTPQNSVRAVKSVSSSPPIRFEGAGKPFANFLEQIPVNNPIDYVKAGEPVNIEKINGQGLYQTVLDTVTRIEEKHGAVLNALAAKGWKVTLMPFLYDRGSRYAPGEVNTKQKRIFLTNTIAETNDFGFLAPYYKPKLRYEIDRESREGRWSCETHNYTKVHEDLIQGLAKALDTVGILHPNRVWRGLGYRQKFSDTPDFRRAVDADFNAIPVLHRSPEKKPYATTFEEAVAQRINPYRAFPDNEPSETNQYLDALFASLGKKG
jgi:hypothetical protein